MKKLIPFATAASLILGSMGTTVYAATFADINQVTWPAAATFINEAASLGLMSGYNENGKKYCKPRNNVTYCETVQLMYSIMKTYSGQDVSTATVTKWKPVISGFDIPEWAYSATAYALENGILDTSDLANLRGGTKYASREAVGVIFGKALDTIPGYDTVANPTLTYQDKAQVSDAAKPYLELLNRASLMVGDTDNKFNPKSNISRAEMAVLSVKSYKKLTDTTTTTPTTQSKTIAATVASSMVMSNGDLFLSLIDNNAQGLSLFADVDTVKPTYQSKTIQFSDIGTGDTVKVTYSGTQISALEVTYSVKGLQSTTYQKTYELSKLTESKVTVKTSDKNTESFRLEDDAKLYLNGSKSTVSKVQAALEDATYDVTLTFNANDQVEKLEAKMNENNPTKGTLVDLDSDEIVIKAGSKKYTYSLADDDITIKKDSKTMTFNKLKSSYEDANYTVSLTLNSKSEVTKITVESEEDETHGTLTALNSRRITIKAGGESYTYNLDADDVDVEIDGKNKSLDDLKEAFKEDEKAFTVELKVDRDDYVTEIIATSQNADADEGILKKLTNSKLTVTVDKKDIQYDLADDVTVKINSKSADLDDLKEYYEDIEFTVALEFDKSGDVSKIQATFEEPEEGELKDINTTRNTITIVAAGVSINLDLDDPDITLDGKSTTLNKLNSALDDASTKEYIRVELEYNSKGKVTEIEAEWVNRKDSRSTKGELQSVSLKKNEITIVDSDGDEYDYEVSKDVVISYSFASSASSDFDKEYKSYDSDDLEGLSVFFKECWKNDLECSVSLTVDDDGEVMRIKAKAE